MRSGMILTIACAAALAGALSVSTIALGQSNRAEQYLKYRKGVYQVIAWNVAPLSAMAQDKQPFDATVFAERARRVALMTPMLAESYAPESRNAADSKLKPEMWTNRADFDEKLDTVVTRSQALAKIAADGDPAASKAAFFDMAQACKACHDKYRAD
jgi:cytochrome c556